MAAIPSAIQGQLTMKWFIDLSISLPIEAFISSKPEEAFALPFAGFAHGKTNAH